VPNHLDTSLLEALAWLGFSKNEARVALALLVKASPTPLSEISRAAALPRSTAHSVLKTLATRGIIFAEGRYPARFRVVPVSRLGTLAQTRLAAARRGVEAASILVRCLKG
jgi:sugar-specific transcriptional regulator TrmB